MKLSMPQMAHLLMQVGDVIPFRRRPQRGEVPGIPEVGPMGGGRVVPMERPRSSQQKYDDALHQQRYGAGAPMVPQFSMQPRASDMQMVRDQWHRMTPQMQGALKQLTPEEAAKFLGFLFSGGLQ